MERTIVEYETSGGTWEIELVEESDGTCSLACYRLGREAWCLSGIACVDLAYERLDEMLRLERSFGRRYVKMSREAA